MTERGLDRILRLAEQRGVYFVARVIVLLLFGGILFFPQEL